MNNSNLPRAEDGSYAGDITPHETWKILETDINALLIDVRTDAEFTYVGTPSIENLGKKTIFIPWLLFPGNNTNPNFILQLTTSVPNRYVPLLFICRSGIRSRFAAATATSVGFNPCYNVLEGFEGDRDSFGHRGTIGGWKVAGLPWNQG